MTAIEATERLQGLRRAVESRPCLDLPDLQVGKMYFATVYGHRGCGFRVLRKSPSARVVMAQNVMQDDGPPIKLPKAHVERNHWGERHRGYHCFSNAEFCRCNELAAIVQREPATA